MPKCGQKVSTANVRLTILKDRTASHHQCVDFPVTYIDRALASALLLRSSNPRVGDSVVRNPSLREEQEVSDRESDLSKTDHLGSRYTFSTLRALIVMLGYLGCLVAPSLSHGSELKQDTLVYWNAYLAATRPQIASQTPFLWVDQKRERLQSVRDGEILVWSVGKENPKPVASGLIKPITCFCDTEPAHFVLQSRTLQSKPFGRSAIACYAS